MTGVELRAYRQSRGLSQPAMAALLRVSPATYRNWEQGRTPVPGPVEALVEHLRECQSAGS